MSERFIWSVFEIFIILIECFILLETISKILAFKIAKKQQIICFISFWILISIPIMLQDYVKLIEHTEIFITITLIIIYAVFALRGSIFKKILFAIALRGLVSVSNSIAIFLFNIIFNIGSNEIFMQTNERLIAVISTKIMFFFITRIVILFFKKDKILDKMQWIIVGVCFLLSSTSQFILISFLRRETLSDFGQTLISILGLFIWLIFLITYYIILAMSKNNKLKMDFALLQQEKESQTEHIEIINKSFQQIQTIKHDTQNCVATIATLIKDEKKEQALDYCSQFSDKVDEIYTIVKTDSPTINAILNNKLSKIKKLNLDVKCSILTGLLQVSQFEFSTVLGNLLDNAIEATQQIFVGGSKTIIICIENKYGFVHLTISNPIEASVLKNNSSFKTAKINATEHGIGHKSVEQTMLDIGGKIIYSESENRFVAQAIFPIV